MPAPDEQPRSSTALLDAARTRSTRSASLDLDALVGDELTDAVLRAAGAARRARRGGGAGAGAVGLARRVAPVRRQDRGGVAGVEAAHPDRRRAAAAAPRPGAARPAAVEKAWAAGEIDRSHVTTMLGVRTARTEKAFERDHEILLDAPGRSGSSTSRRTAIAGSCSSTPTAPSRAPTTTAPPARCTSAESFGGMWFGKITLDPISGEIVHTTLQLIERELFEADWAAAKERLGREPTILDLDRTPAQRRADALVEMATRARTAPADGRRPAPLFIGAGRLRDLRRSAARAVQPHRAHPGTAARWLTEADIERVVFDGPSRVHRRRCQAPLLPRRPAPTPSSSATAPASTPAATSPRSTRRSTTSRRLSKGGPTTQSQRPPRLRLPQPLAQPPPRRRVGPRHPRHRRPRRRPRPTSD